MQDTDRLQRTTLALRVIPGIITMPRSVTSAHYALGGAIPLLWEPQGMKSAKTARRARGPPLAVRLARFAQGFQTRTIDLHQSLIANAFLGRLVQMDRRVHLAPPTHLRSLWALRRARCVPLIHRVRREASYARVLRDSLDLTTRSAQHVRLGNTSLFLGALPAKTARRASSLLLQRKPALQLVKIVLLVAMRCSRAVWNAYNVQNSVFRQMAGLSALAWMDISRTDHYASTLPCRAWVARPASFCRRKA